MVGYSNNLGNIHYSEEVLAKIVGLSTMECYGVVGMASQKTVRDGWAELLKKENYARGVVVRNQEDGLVLDLYIIALQGIKLSEVVIEAQKRVKYEIEKTLEIKCKEVNICVQGVRILK